MAGRLLAWKGTCPIGRCWEWKGTLYLVNMAVGLCPIFFGRKWISLWPLSCDLPWKSSPKKAQLVFQRTSLPRLQTRHLVEDHPQRPDISLAKTHGSSIGMKISSRFSSYTTDPLWEHDSAIPHIFGPIWFSTSSSFVWERKIRTVTEFKGSTPPKRWIPALTPYGLFLQISGERYEGVPTVELASNTGVQIRWSTISK